MTQANLIAPPCKVGDRIKLIRMGKDPDPIPAGSTGTVTSMADLSAIYRKPDFSISVKWDGIDRSLSLVWPEDKIEVIQ